MDKIGTALEPTLQKLSEVFCVSVDTIRENGMEYILMYGEYHWVATTIHNVLMSLLAWAICLVLIIFIAACWIEDTYDESEERFRKTASIVFTVSLLILLCGGAFLASSIPYWVSPEMYSIKAVAELAGIGV